MFRLPELHSLFLCLFLVCTSGLVAQLKIPAVFSDNMVLQRNKPLPVWGKANPGTSVTVSFLSQQKTAIANKDSNWSVTLDPLVLSATPAGNGLISNDGQSLTWFSIAGKDGKFVPAIAVIKNNAVELFSAEIKKPKHIRFAWNETAQPNFFNKDGLPALPFRTDHL